MLIFEGIPRGGASNMLPYASVQTASGLVFSRLGTCCELVTV